MKGVKGFDREAFEAVHKSGEQVVSVRMNDEKWLKAEGVGCKAEGEGPAIEGLRLKVEGSVPWCAHGKYLQHRPSFTLDPLLHGGAYYVQEASSMFLWHVLEQTVEKNIEGLKVLDLCAAPGGKSTLLASYFKKGFIVSNEVIKSRASVLVENITKWGSANVVVTNNNPKDFTALQNYFDVIVVDAPCSGSGLFRRDPAAIEEWSGENVLLCSRRQQRIVADIYAALKKNGVLIYSTCSYSKEEDEDIVDWMMDDLRVSSYRLQVGSDWRIIEAESEKHKGYSYRFFPDKVKGEGFFIAAFKKNDGDDFSYRYPQLQSAAKQEINIASDWIKKNEELFFFKQNENIIAIPTQWQQDVALLQKNLYLRKAGVTIGAVKGKELIPNHELALSLLLNENVSRCHLNYEQAIQYLKKKDLLLENIMKGWGVVEYCDVNLGWVKVLHNRVNNYYPANWRILKD